VQYFCTACATMHDLHIPPGYTVHCGTCGRPQVVCNADVRGSGVAGATYQELPISAELVESTATPTVSLPNNVKQDAAQKEDTQGLEEDGLPPPSGWRDRPGLL
jgi:hypothetical protein